MLERKRWSAAAAVVGVLLLGGLTTAVSQEAEGPALDVDGLAAEMQLDDEGRAELEQLADLMDRRRGARRRMMAVGAEMHRVMRSLHDRLTPQQSVALRRAMRDAMHRTGSMHAGMEFGQAMHHGRAGHHHRGGTDARGPGGMMSGAGAVPGTGGRMHADCPWVPGGGDADGDSGS